jgi:hypothetical protein
MSDVQKGATRVRRVEQMLHRLGFRTMIASRSGQRRGSRHDSLAMDGDLIALAPDDSGYCHLIIEVGGKGKSVRASLLKMRQHALPAGFEPIVARLVNSTTRAPGKGWRFSNASGAHDSLLSLLESLKGE